MVIESADTRMHGKPNHTWLHFRECPALIALLVGAACHSVYSSQSVSQVQRSAVPQYASMSTIP
jgi:hypothetical protein